MSGLRLTEHPRAHRQIRAAKGWGGLVGLALGVLIGLRSGATFESALSRGLLVGIAGYLVVWAIAVTVWREVARAELVRFERELVAKRRAAIEGEATETTEVTA